MSTHHEAAIWQEYAAKKGLIPAKPVENEAYRPAAPVHEHFAPRKVEPCDAWYHDTAVETPSPKQAH